MDAWLDERGDRSLDVYTPLRNDPVPHAPGCARCDAGLCHGCGRCGEGRYPHRIAQRRIPGRWIAFVGARDHANPAQLDEVIDALDPTTVVVSGGARGIDSYGVDRARARGLRAVVLEADWTRLGKAAGYIRNHEMALCVDATVAAPWWGCPGTLAMLEMVDAMGMPVLRIRPRAAQLEVWTTRLSPSIADPDLFDITLASTSAQDKAMARTWEALPADRRITTMVAELRRTEATLSKQPGATPQLAEVLRMAKAAHTPAIGRMWAPTPALLGTAKGALRRVSADLERAQMAGEGEDALAAARAGDEAVWASYAPAFLDLLRDRMRRFPVAWGWLLGRPRIVLGCFCSPPSYRPHGTPWTHCHRFLVAGALEACGATYRGELPGSAREGGQLGLTFRDMPSAD